MDELEFHKLMMEYLSASDERPKNIELKGKPQGTSGFKRFSGTKTLAYNERYHKWKIIEILEYSILSGYEVDSSIYYTGFDKLMYKQINVGEGVSIVISREDYERLWDEAFKNTDKEHGGCAIHGIHISEEVIQDSESKFAVFDGRKYGGDIILYRQNRK